MANQPASQQNAQIIQGLIQEIAANDPGRAQALAQSYQSYQVNEENQRLRMQQAQAETERTIRAADERNVEELRAIVVDLGADPDSPSIDYGDANDWFADRITKARASAKAAAKQAKPVTPPTRTVADGTAHNTQPGSPPQPARTSNSNSPVTEDQVAQAQAEYARAFLKGGPAREAAEKKMNELNDRLAAQLFA